MPWPSSDRQQVRSDTRPGKAVKTRAEPGLTKQVDNPIFASPANAAYDRTVRFRIAVLLLPIAVVGAATAAVVGSGNPTGQWATPAAVQSVILSRGVGLLECGPGRGACKFARPFNQLHIDAEVPTNVVSATVTGIGPSKLINGVRRYQLFDVRACTIYYYRGAHRFSAHFRWFTHRPPGGVITTTDHDGKRSVVRDDGEPYAEDWNHPYLDPLARDRC
jgi:hypothetical protein